jgi:hypothetical protein
VDHRYTRRLNLKIMRKLSMSDRPQTPDEFIAHFAVVTAAIGSASLDTNLEAALNRDFSADDTWFKTAFSLCRKGVSEGWLCSREGGGIKFGRAVPASEHTHGFSIDVVEMQDLAGPHHSHPNGEIDLIMPLDTAAEFDGKGAGWMVYEPGSAHRPTVANGKALVLYLLPEGAIEFTR